MYTNECYQCKEKAQIKQLYMKLLLLMQCESQIKHHTDTKNNCYQCNAKANLNSCTGNDSCQNKQTRCLHPTCLFYDNVKTIPSKKNPEVSAQRAVIQRTDLSHST